jgi:hypothetical protein
MKQIDESLIILRFLDDAGIIHDIDLTSIIEGGMPIDAESGEDMEHLDTYIIE